METSAVPPKYFIIMGKHSPSYQLLYFFFQLLDPINYFTQVPCTFPKKKKNSAKFSFKNAFLSTYPPRLLLKYLVISTNEWLYIFFFLTITPSKNKTGSLFTCLQTAKIRQDIYINVSSGTIHPFY